MAEKVFQSFFSFGFLGGSAEKNVDCREKKEKSSIVWALEPRHPVILFIFLQLAQKAKVDVLLLSENKSVAEIVANCQRCFSKEKKTSLVIFSACDGDESRKNDWFFHQKSLAGENFSLDIFPSFLEIVERFFIEQDFSFYHSQQSKKKDCVEINHFLTFTEKEKKQNRLLFFTSGSTANPKLIVFEKKMIHSAVACHNKNFRFDHNHRWALTLPLFHVSGLSILFRAFLGGGEVCCFCDAQMTKKWETLEQKNDSEKEYLSTALRAKYDKMPMWSAFEVAKITHLSTSVYQLRRYVFLNEEHVDECDEASFLKGKHDSPSKQSQEQFISRLKSKMTWRFIFIGGGMIPQWVFQMCLLEKNNQRCHKNNMSLQNEVREDCRADFSWRSLPILRPTYGMSETFGQLATWNGRDEKYFFQVLDGRNVMEKNESFFIHREASFSGYMLDGNVFCERENGEWWECEDCVKMFVDESVYRCKNSRDFLIHLTILGRKTNVIITGGENVLAEEVEQKLLQSSFFFSVVVLGLPHPAWGEELVCVCVLRQENMVAQCAGDKNRWKKLFYEPLFQQVLRQLENYQRPKKYFLWKGDEKNESFLTNPLAKINRSWIKKNVEQCRYPLFYSVD